MTRDIRWRGGVLGQVFGLDLLKASSTDVCGLSGAALSSLQRNWAVRHHVRRNPYSEDLRKKIVQAVERGMPKIQAAKTFGVDISFIKCYVATYRKGGALAPKKRPGSKPKLDESARKLLEANLEEHPEHCATRESVSVVLSSYNTLS